MVAGNATPIVAGHAYSVEPGIYVPNKWGMRLEDIVIATENGPMPVNHANHHLVILDK
jgi:Xaa-Pro aminopeptidase